MPYIRRSALRWYDAVAGAGQVGALHTTAQRLPESRDVRNTHGLFASGTLYTPTRPARLLWSGSEHKRARAKPFAVVSTPTPSPYCQLVCKWSLCAMPSHRSEGEGIFTAL